MTTTDLPHPAASRARRGPATKAYDNARTAHLERLRATGGRLMFRARRYDFDEDLARTLDVRQCTRRQIVRHIVRDRPEVLEVNEPAQVEAWRSLLLYVTVCRLLALTRRGAPRLVAYAIANGDVAAAVRRRSGLPAPLSRVVAGLVMRYLAGAMDRLCFGTPGSRDVYAGYVPARTLDRRSENILALPCPAAGIHAADKAAPTVTFLGAFDHRKGVLRLMAAWPRVRAALGGAVRLTIVGKGPLEDEIRAWSRDREDVDLLVDPPRAVIDEVLRATRVLVLLSQPGRTWREQVGLPIVEGLARGCEVVASTETGLAPWLAGHGHGVLPPDVDDAGLARAVAARVRGHRDPDTILADLPEVDSRLAAENWMFAP